jgi:hypothetical protein
MKARIILIILPLFILITVAAIAAQTDKGDARLRELDPLGGKWTCKGTAFAMGDSPQHAVIANLDGKWILGGKWLDVHYTETKTKANPNPFEVRAFFSYDPEQKKLVLGSIQSDGGYSTETSTGWEGDRIVFVGPNHMGGTTLNGRDTWTKKGKSGMTYTFEVEDKGKWGKVIEETCTR